MFLTNAFAYFSNDDQTRVYPDSYRQANLFFLFQTGIESCHSLDDAQPRMDSTPGIVLMSWYFGRSNRLR